MNLVTKLLRKNLSTAQVAGFILSNFIGLAIVVAGLQLFQDVRSIWEDEDSFIKKDYLIINKKVTSANTVGDVDATFSDDEIADLKRQPWVRDAGSFTAVDYRVNASIQSGSRGMSTYMFFESIPDKYVDVADGQWHYTDGATDVPIIISKDYLTLYNFGFASSAGMPQISEQLMSSIPMKISVSSEDATRTATFNGRIVGFSNRLNTILVPESFMRWSNRQFGNAGTSERRPSRLIIDVSNPGDMAINKYLDDHSLETAGDKKSSQASYLLNVVAGIVLGVGIVITVLSFFILMLSISLLMQKNREKLHLLLMLGYPLRRVAAPYNRLIVLSTCASLVLAIVVMFVFRFSYLARLEAVGGGGDNLWLAPLAGLVLTALIIVFNVMAVGRKVASAWRI